MISQSISQVSSLEPTSYLSFTLGGEHFAIPVENVQEILSLPKITKVPHAPLYMRGVINLRGSALPVIDTAIKFGMGQTEQTVHTCIIVLNILLEGETIAIGAQVDGVQEVVEIEPGQIGPAPSIGSKYKSAFIKGMVKTDEAFLMLLCIDRLFSTDELLVVKEAHV